ncbi:MAG: hypothetical protein KAX16_08295, partial [Actinomycetia bacterium]|nr:hypothetical protein [Actinomycetes bacterium]
STLESGSHATHLNSSSGRGPNIALSCDLCHGIDAVDGLHVDHQNADLDNPNFYESSITTLAQTDICDTCHSDAGTWSGVNTTDTGAGLSVGAKDNWDAGVYTDGSLSTGKELWCVGCHDTSPPTIESITAPNISGNMAQTYGFFNAGHGLDASSTYDKDAIGDAAGNTGANKICTDCHDNTKDHITGVDDTDMDGQRILNTINGEVVADIADACRSCHQVTTGSPATKRVSNHGNAFDGGAGFSSPAEGPFSVFCPQCHDPHLASLNSTGTKNLKMVRPDTQITTTQTGDVVFTNTTGLDSFDETDTESTDTSPTELNAANNNDDICVTCHVNPANDGMTNHTGAFG